MTINLPVNVRNAKLPETYEQAKQALSACTRVDECQSWADKAEALASYAKQAKDDSLRRHADKIQARAIRRAGELLKQIEPKHTGRPKNGAGTVPNSRKTAATEAGLSERQRKTAIRVASVPRDEFEAAVESDEPATVTELAARGTKRRRTGERAAEVRGWLNRAKEAAQLAKYADLSTCPRSKEMKKAAAEALAAWTEVNKHLLSRRKK